MPFKRSLVTVLITLAVLSCMSLNCFADISYEITSDTEVKVCIDFGADAKNKAVGVTVENPFKSLDDIVVDETSGSLSGLEEVFSFVKQTTADAEGKATVTFTPTGDAGWYTVTAAYEKCRNTESLRIPYVKQQAILDLIEDIKDATDDSVVRSLFATPVHDDELAGYVILDLYETEAYEKIFKKISSDTIKDSIYTRLSEELKVAENTDDVKRIFSNVVFSEKLFSIENANELKQYIKDYDSELGLTDSDIYKGIYLSSNLCGPSLIKPHVLKAIMDYDWTEESKKDFVGTCEEIIFLNSLYHTNVYSKIGDMIEVAKELLTEKGADLDDLEKVSSKTDVYRAVSGEKYADIPAFVLKLNEAINPAPKKENKPLGGGGGGGGRVEISNDLNTVTPPAKLESRFKDLENVSWAVDAIEYLAEKGIVSGKEKNKFYPNAQMTREEFAKVLVLSFNLLDSEAETNFADVQQGDWYYEYVASANKKNIIKGYGDSFGTGDPITRQDLATIVCRAVDAAEKKLGKIGEYKGFADEDQIADYALESVKKLYSAGIINGMDESNFRPAGFATRAQVAKIIYGIMVNWE